MEIAITVLLLIVGLVLIIKGGDFFVDAASWMAEASGIPKLIVGATVVSFATTLPELLVSIFAALDARAAEALSPGSGIGMVDMSIGNAIGSVTANLGLIMGIALVAIPMAIRRKDYMLKMILMLVAAAVTVCFSLFDNGVGMVASVLLIIIFVIAMYDNIHEAVVAVKGGAKGQQLDEPVTKKAVITNVVKFLIGAVGTVAGAQLLACFHVRRFGSRHLRHHHRHRHVSAGACHHAYRHREKAGLALRRQHHRRKYHRSDLDSARMRAHLRQ